MSHYPKLTLSDDEYRLAMAYAADRGYPLATIAKAALMAEVKRHAGRSGLLTAIRDIAKEEVQKRMADALVFRSHVGEEHLHTASTTHPWVSGEKEASDVC